ncbi:MAG: PIN domain-containing protein [Spirochaetaceae bacterium]|nr:MAG: PIN domain-containing protein [Spirochaetaceae bacterium]
MIFIDSSIPVYLIGADHANKDRAVSILERLVRDEERLVTDAEVFQEMLHHYTAIAEPAAIDAAYELLLQVADDVLPVTIEDAVRAKSLLVSTPGLTVRCAVHAAVMTRHGIRTVFSFDPAFDSLRILSRLS